jgi:hypothetical protein
LEILGKSLFKLTILGHRSKILAKYVFEQFSKKYLDAMKRYKEEGVFLLPTEEVVEPVQMNFNQIYLQECLLMTLWAVLNQLGARTDKEIDLIAMLEIFPVKIESADPLALELSLNINAALKDSGLFPKISCPLLNAENFPAGRLKEFYGRNFSESPISLLMKEEAQATNLFTTNYNPKQNMFLAERWSGQKTYDPAVYIKFCL